jgi:SAM-dependent methyltransferase
MSEFAERDRELFERIAQDYARKDLRPAHRLARRHRLLQTLRMVPNRQDLEVLEVGCGAGYAAAYMKGLYRRFVGIDYSEQLIRYATEVNKQPGASFRICDVEDLESDRQFDLIFMIGVLHHLARPELVLQHLRACLKPGGWLVANEPRRGNPLIDVARYVRKRIDSSYSADQREYSPEELRSLYEAAGFRNVTTFPQGIFSTPIAEVVLPLQVAATVLSKIGCSLDTWLESHAQAMVKGIAWNVVVQGQRSAGSNLPGSASPVK